MNKSDKGSNQKQSSLKGIRTKDKMNEVIRHGQQFSVLLSSVPSSINLEVPFKMRLRNSKDKTFCLEKANMHHHHIPLCSFSDI